MQIRYQCDCILRANDLLEANMLQAFPDEIFFYLQSFLVAAANVSKLFWAQDDGASNIRRRIERKPLREAFGVNEYDVLWRRMRNNFEHIDTRIDSWWEKFGSEEFHDMAFSDTPSERAFNSRTFRFFNTNDRVLTFWKEEFHLNQIVDEAKRLLACERFVPMTVRPYAPETDYAAAMEHLLAVVSAATTLPEALLDEYPPGYDGRIATGEFYACPLGMALWDQYHAAHPESPAEPPEGSEDMPDAVAYWAHANDCEDCNEV